MAKASKIKLLDIDVRMLQLIDILKEAGTIRFAQEFCDAVGLAKQNLVNIRKGTQYFTREHLQKASESFNVNGNWLLGTSKEVFRQQAAIRFIREGMKPATKGTNKKEKRG